MTVVFEWDPEKARGNLRKHGVSFEEAKSAFLDPNGATYLDPDHSSNERREILWARSERGRLLVVGFVVRGERLRIITARVASKKERRETEKSGRR